GCGVVVGAAAGSPPPLQPAASSSTSPAANRMGRIEAGEVIPAIVEQPGHQLVSVAAMNRRLGLARLCVELLVVGPSNTHTFEGLLWLPARSSPTPTPSESPAWMPADGLSVARTTRS